MGFLGVKGPKELLASSIAGALSTYFEVDEKAIESNLLQDSKIVIKNAKLQPQTIFSDHDEDDSLLKVSVSGSVEEVLLKWTWVLGKSDEHAWMKDVTLLIRGFVCTAELDVVKRDENDSIMRTQHSDTKSKELKNGTNQNQQGGRLEQYIRNQVEEIIDALNLIIADFKLTLILPKGKHDNEKVRYSGFSIGGTKLELKSLGRQREVHHNVNREEKRENMTLVQYLTIGDFSINVIELDEKLYDIRILPLLSPICYEATATKHGGKRFDSLGTGLTFNGHILPSKEGGLASDSDIVFHMGLAQIQSLSHLATLALKHNPKNAAISIDASAVESEEKEKRETDNGDQLESLKQLAMTCSIFIFPIASIALVLPNDVKIKLQSFTCSYHTDGTFMNMKAAHGAGILIDDFPLISTKCKDIDGIDTYWMFDLITNCFSVECTDNDLEQNTEGATIRLNPTISNKVFEGLNMTLEALSSIPVTSVNQSQDKSEEKALKANSSWLVDIKQKVGIILEKQYQDDTKLDQFKINVGALSASVPLTSSSKLTCEGLSTDECSFGQLSFTIPKICQSPNSLDIYMDGEMSLVVDSQHVLEGVMGLVRSFVLPSSEVSIKKEEESKPNNNVIDLRVHIPSIKMSIRDESGLKLSMHNVVVSIQPSMEISIGSLDSLLIPNVFSVLEPITDLKISYTDELVNVKGNKITLLMLNSPEEIDEKHQNSDSSKSPLKVPIGMNVTFDKIILKRDVVNKTRERRTELSIIELSFSVKAESSGYIPIAIGLAEAKCNFFEILRTDASALINVTDRNEIKNLKLRCGKSIKIYAGHSFTDWSGMFVKLFHQKKKELSNTERPLQLPHCYISTLQINVSYNFSKLTKTDSLIQTSEFIGNSETKSDDLINFYKERVINQVPGFLQDTNVLGVNVAETAVLVGSYGFGVGTTIASFQYNFLCLETMIL